MPTGKLGGGAALVYEIGRMIEGWEPPAAPHCSDCANCRVYGRPDAPLAYCAAGHDGTQGIDLGRLIRRKQARGWRSAARCPDFVSMSDDKEKGVMAAKKKPMPKGKCPKCGMPMASCKCK